MSWETVIECPFPDCGDRYKNHNHMYINFETKRYHCFYCERYGSLPWLINRFPEIKRLLNMAEVNTYIRKWKDEQRIKFDTLFFRPVLDSTSKIANTIIEYLKRRGFIEEDINRCKVMMSPQLPLQAIFPHTVGGAKKFWAARAVIGKSRKWLFPRQGTTEKTKSEVVWGLEEAVAFGEKDIWLCEGIFDAVATSGVCVFGRRPSPLQLRAILKTNPHRIIIAFDRDAEEYGRRLQKELRAVVPTQLRIPKKYKDYGEYLARGIRRRYNESKFDIFDM